VAEPSFTRDIKPRFRDKDRSAMLNHFDLWSVADVREHAAAILEAVKAGTMPCDEKWSADGVDLFARWIAGGMEE